MRRGNGAHHKAERGKKGTKASPMPRLYLSRALAILAVVGAVNWLTTSRRLSYYPSVPKGNPFRTAAPF